MDFGVKDAFALYFELREAEGCVERNEVTITPGRLVSRQHLNLIDSEKVKVLKH